MNSQVEIVHNAYQRAERTTRPLCGLYAIAYQQALKDIALEFERHDYFSEAKMVRSFATTSDWQFKEETNDGE